MLEKKVQPKQESCERTRVNRTQNTYNIQQSHRMTMSLTGNNLSSTGILIKRITELTKRFIDNPNEQQKKTQMTGTSRTFAIYSVAFQASSSIMRQMERKFFVGGNWKMNGSDKMVEDVVNLLKEFELDKNVEIVVCPPSVYLQKTGCLLPSNVYLGAQNCYKEAKGSFTGEISPAMIKEVGGKWVILGHSERRNLFNENDETVSDKTAHAHDEGIGVIVCVGETTNDKENNRTKEVVLNQIKAISKKVKDWKKTVIAYEPIWAIGTGKSATPKQVQEVHGWIREWLRSEVNDEVAQETRIIYGGSVNAQNAKELSRQKDVDGFLVGGASLKPEFIQIINVLKQ
ncbi:triosephosphate isomerase-like [Cimex lectularius]|uniref:Triosephosphate isomerase n=1 Tax=Cimex lectularius TaxID=79782 RepID=A0A8I6RQS4_CIMLE|nr:triosephosphate isomerase-like [Cimex lectularius]